MEPSLFSPKFPEILPTKDTYFGLPHKHWNQLCKLAKGRASTVKALEL